MEKNKILGIISIILCIIGWILYSKIGIILAILIEIGALILAIYSGKKQKNIFATIGIIGAVILIVMMVVVLLGIGVYNVGDNALINKTRQIEQSK